MISRKCFVCGLSAFVTLAMSGCGSSEGPAPAAPQSGTNASDAAVDVVVTDEMKQILDKADALDGNRDKIVVRCASCALGMDGSSKHPLHVGEYTMYFCTDHCRQTFREDVARSVLDMKVPNEDGTDAGDDAGET